MPKTSRLLGLTIALGLFCGSFLTGCTTIAFVVSDDTDYLIREGTSTQKFHAVNIAIQQHLIPAGPRQHILLVSDLPSAKNEWKLRSLVNNTSPWRRLDRLYDVAAHLLYDDPIHGDQLASVRWI